MPVDVRAEYPPGSPPGREPGGDASHSGYGDEKAADIGRLMGFFDTSESGHKFGMNEMLPEIWTSA